MHNTLPINESDNRFLTDYRNAKYIDTDIRKKYSNITNIIEYKKLLNSIGEKQIVDGRYQHNLDTKVNKLKFINKIYVNV